MAAENENQDEGSDRILKCPECGSRRIRETSEAELVCQSCGTVLDQDRIKESSGPRAFTSEEREKKERTGSPITFTEPSRGLRTKIGSGSQMGEVSPEKRGQYQRMRKWHRRLDESRDRRMKLALNQIESLAAVFGLPDSVVEEVARLYEKALEKEVVKGRKVEAVAASLIYIVARNHGVPRTMAEIAEETGIDERELGRTYRYVAREQDLRIVPVNPEDFLPRFASKLGIDGETQARAREMIIEAREDDIMAGRSPDSVVASAIYLACKIMDKDIPQKKIAEEIGVTEVTIRKGYSKMAEGLGIEEELE